MNTCLFFVNSIKRLHENQKLIVQLIVLLLRLKIKYHPAHISDGSWCALRKCVHVLFKLYFPCGKTEAGPTRETMEFHKLFLHTTKHCTICFWMFNSRTLFSSYTACVILLNNPARVPIVFNQWFSSHNPLFEHKNDPWQANYIVQSTNKVGLIWAN